MEADARVREELHGSVDHIVFRNEDTGWTVMQIETDEGEITAVGELPMVVAGETVTLRGYFTEHATFGRQFRAEICERYLPTDTSAIFRYLASGAVKGVGPAIALRIVNAFGTDALKIMEKEPQRLSEVKGISPQKAEAIGEAFAAQFGLREIMLAFAEYGLTASEAVRCFKRWGSRTVETVKENPFLLCSGGLHIGFERADAIARELNCPPDDPRRIDAGILYVLRHNTVNGHTCLPQRKLVPAAASLLGVAQEPVETRLSELEQSLDVQKLVTEKDIFWYLPAFYRAERYIAARMSRYGAQRIEREEAEQRLNAWQENVGIMFEEEQRRAVLQAVCGSALILTGGPGTGKTTALKGILAILESYRERVVLCAPTGRAAKRIAELTGVEAKTIHRLLEVQWGEEDSLVFARHEHNPLEADAVIIDEMSMVDELLFENLLRAMPDGCRLIMVGDADQLPAVGPGRILGDLIEGGKIPTVALKRVFRQALESHIVECAHRIVDGEYPFLGYKDGDFFFLNRPDVHAAAQTVEDLCMRRLPDTYGVSLLDGLQVLCPSRKGELGTISFNARLQAFVNSKSENKPEIALLGGTLRQGDKVMHIRNNYDIPWTRDNGEVGSGIFNGDIGILETVDPREQTVSVRFDDRVAFYTREDAADLELAYAVTVHKSQGSEFDAVVLPIGSMPPLLCYRQLLYTAVTRARRLLVIVGNADILRQMVDNHRKTLRYTGLVAMLSEGSGIL